MLILMLDVSGVSVRYGYGVWGKLEFHRSGPLPFNVFAVFRMRYEILASLLSQSLDSVTH